MRDFQFSGWSLFIVVTMWFLLGVGFGFWIGAHS